MEGVSRQDLERRLEARLGPGLGAVDLSARLLDVAGDVRASRILDVGCGTGELCRLLSERGASVVGVDLCSNLVDRARREAPASAFCKANAEDLPFGSASFDLVTSLLVLHYLSDPRRALSEIARVLMPGGRLLLCDRIVSADPVLRCAQDRLERLRNPQLQRVMSSSEIGEVLRTSGFSVSWEADYDRIIPLEAWLAGADAGSAREAREEVSRLAGRDLGGVRIAANLDIELRMRLFVTRMSRSAADPHRIAS
jgi:SAM-dependent methyltransferase